jgi:hypothetical protein
MESFTGCCGKSAAMSVDAMFRIWVIGLTCFPIDMMTSDPKIFYM